MALQGLLPVHVFISPHPASRCLWVARTVYIFGEEIVVREKIFILGGFSAHADQKELLGWRSLLKNSPRIFVVHGEEEISLEFSESIKKQYGFTTRGPYKNESFEL